MPKRIARRCGVFLAVFVAFLVGCSLPGPPTQPSAGPRGSQIWTAKEAYPIVRTWAKQWRSDFVVDAIDMEMAAEQVERGLDTITYYLASDRAFGPWRWWDYARVTVDAHSGQIQSTHTECCVTKWQSRRGGFDVEAAQQDSSDVLRLAEQQGGAAFRQHYPHSRVVIVAEMGGTWQVIYALPFGSHPLRPGLPTRLVFWIKDRTGEVTRQPELPPEDVDWLP